ncbi:unnamed protein product [Haemonchus placei]|uniref:Uncharacterized protein n=1 Tax=Haemonchus placei TaxID=6290 RepID=A0A0N4X842_HAEPC|nr:unnamed protein product [Haemonchus placei]
MFCCKRKNHSRKSGTSSSQAAVCPGHNQPCRGFLTEDRQQTNPSSQSSNDHRSNSAPQIHVVEDLPCPVSFYPNNVYGQGLESDWGNRVDVRMNMILDGPNYHSPMRDPTVPLPPGAVVVQIIQPSAPPLSPPHQPQQLSLPLYPRLPPLDQNYADQQMAIQK